MLDRVEFKIVFFIKMIKYRITYKNTLKIGKYFSFRRRFNININASGNVSIGNNVFFNNDCSINCKSKITIGDNCIFGENVKIYDHNHIFSCYDKPIIEQGYKLNNVSIGNNCWIGSNVVILPGTTIGANTVVGAGCVIAGNVPEGMIVTMNRKLDFRQRKRID